MPLRVADLIEQLMSQPGPIARLVGRWESILQQIEQTGEVEAALGLLPIGLASRGIFREEALALLDRLVRACPPGALAGLEARARDRESDWRRDAWAVSREVTPDRLASITDRVTALGVASLHASGWVRGSAGRGSPPPRSARTTRPRRSVEAGTCPLGHADTRIVGRIEQTACQVGFLLIFPG